MALIERLMGLNADGSEPTGLPDRPRIPVHLFHAACVELVEGRVTVANIKTALQMDASEASEFDALAALAPGTATARMVYAMTIHSVLLAAEASRAGRYQLTGYDTPAGVRAKLGID